MFGLKLFLSNYCLIGFYVKYTDRRNYGRDMAEKYRTNFHINFVEISTIIQVSTFNQLNHRFGKLEARSKLY